MGKPAGKAHNPGNRSGWRGSESRHVPELPDRECWLVLKTAAALPEHLSSDCLSASPSSPSSRPVDHFLPSPLRPPPGSRTDDRNRPDTWLGSQTAPPSVQLSRPLHRPPHGSWSGFPPLPPRRRPLVALRLPPHSPGWRQRGASLNPVDVPEPSGLPSNRPGASSAIDRRFFHSRFGGFHYRHHAAVHFANQHRHARTIRPIAFRFFLR